VFEEFVVVEAAEDIAMGDVDKDDEDDGDDVVVLVFV
jgi:hypothetical protein